MVVLASVAWFLAAIGLGCIVLALVTEAAQVNTGFPTFLWVELSIVALLAGVFLLLYRLTAPGQWHRG